MRWYAHARVAAERDGKLADVVAVPRNPLDDITAMHEVSFVMKDGRIYKQNGEAQLRTP